MAVAVTMKIRLDKYLANMGYGTRSQIKKAITEGSVTVNGSIVKRPETKVDTEVDIVCFSGKPAAYRSYEYYMMNKPAGVVCATQDKKERTVLELLADNRRKDLFPTGRLDKDTEGLLLITNDGDLAHRLLSPGKHVDKVYFVRVQGRLDTDDIEMFARGLDIGDKNNTLPAELKIITSGETSEAEVTIREGRYHQIKRMFHSVGKNVLYLKRLRMGSLVLDATLGPGEYRRLTEKETEELRQGNAAAKNGSVKGDLLC